MIVILLGLIMSACSEEKNNFETADWSGDLLTGGEVKFSELKSPTVVLNFYSPTCRPCIEELPALNLLYQSAKIDKIPVYIAVEANPESHGLPVLSDDPREERLSAIKKRLLEDVERYDIRVPMVILSDRFRMNPEYGLITGTPETMLFSTDPFVLRYNFIGPLSVLENPNDLMMDSRLTFAMEQVKRVASH